MNKVKIYISVLLFLIVSIWTPSQAHAYNIRPIETTHNVYHRYKNITDLNLAMIQYMKEALPKVVVLANTIQNNKIRQQQMNKPLKLIHHNPPVVQAPIVAADSAGSVNGEPCGGNLPPCYVLQRESHGNPYAVNPGHSGAPYGDPGDPLTHASGLYQDMPGTWNHYMGYPYAAAAPVSVQVSFNIMLWNNGRGCSNWSAC